MSKANVQRFLAKCCTRSLVEADHFVDLLDTVVACVQARGMVLAAGTCPICDQAEASRKADLCRGVQKRAHLQMNVTHIA